MATSKLIRPGVAAALSLAMVAAVLVAGAPPARAVVNGVEVSNERFEGAWPWTVHVSSTPTGPCTGTLVAPTWVLTAGHCVSGADTTTIRYGHADRSQAFGVTASSIHVHPAYVGSTATDVALVELPEPVGVAPAPLATTGRVGAGDTVDVAGWGLTSPTATEAPLVLVEASLELSGRSDDMLHFGPSSASTCSGDSGGPMVVPDTRLVVGVASFVVLPCGNGGGHVAVDAVFGWLDTTVGGLPAALQPDHYRTAPDQPLLVAAAEGLLSNDAPYVASPVVEVVEPPLGGTLDLSADGGFTYVPASGFNGIDTFLYRVDNGNGPSLATAVTIVVNAPPVATDDQYFLEVDPDAWTGQAQLVVAAPGVLANDVDPDGSPLTAALHTELSPSGGEEGVDAAAVTLGLDGGFDVTVAGDPWSLLSLGELAFTYRASDGTEASAPVVVTITACMPADCPAGDVPPPPEPSPTLEIGDTLDTLVAPTADGTTWSLADVDDEVVILHLCALDCSPCQQLASSLVEGLALLEADYGADRFEIVEVLVGGLSGQPSTADQATLWRDEVSGSSVPVIHADGSHDSAVSELARALAVTAFPTLVVLDAHRRIVGMDTPQTAEPFVAAIDHGLAVGALPLDLAFGAAAPTEVTIGIGDATGTSAWGGSPSSVALSDDSRLMVDHQWDVSPASSLDWWTKQEQHALLLVDESRVGSDAPAVPFAGDAEMTVGLGGLAWEDGYARRLTAVARPLYGTLEAWEYGEDIDAGDSHTGGVVTIGPFRPVDGWPAQTIAVEVTLLVVPDLTDHAGEPIDLLEELGAAVEAAGLNRGTVTPLSARIDTARRLLGDDQPANDSAVPSVLESLLEQLRDDVARGDVPAELGEAWIAAVERVHALLDPAPAV